MESSTYKINVLSNLAKTRYLSFRRKGKISTTKITQPRLKGPEAGGDRKWPTGSTKPVLTVKRQTTKDKHSKPVPSLEGQYEWSSGHVPRRYQNGELKEVRSW